MKQRISVLLVIVALIALAAPVGAAPVALRLSHDLPETSPQHQAALEFKRVLEEKTGGEILVSVFPNGQLGTDAETVTKMQAGILEASLVPTAKLSRFDPALQIVDLPFLFPSKEVCYCVLDSDVGKELLAALGSVGLKGLAFWESGFKHFTADKAIRKPSDFEGLRIRVMNSPILMEQFRVMGATPIPIDFAKVYQALKNKVVNGQENPLASIVGKRFYEVQSHMTLSGHGYLGYAFLVGASFWDKLNPDQQAAVQGAAMETAAYERKLTAEKEADLLGIIEQSGTEIIRLTEEQRRAFETATKPVHEKFAEAVGEETLRKVYSKIADCQ